MNTNMMELNMNEMELVNGGSHMGKKLETIARMAGAGAEGGAGVGFVIGSMAPGVGTALGTAVGTAVGATVFGGIGAIKAFFFDD